MALATPSATASFSFTIVDDHFLMRSLHHEIVARAPRMLYFAFPGRAGRFPGLTLASGLWGILATGKRVCAGRASRRLVVQVVEGLPGEVQVGRAVAHALLTEAQIGDRAGLPTCSAPRFSFEIRCRLIPDLLNAHRAHIVAIRARPATPNTLATGWRWSLPSIENGLDEAVSFPEGHIVPGIGIEDAQRQEPELLASSPVPAVILEGGPKSRVDLVQQLVGLGLVPDSASCRRRRFQPRGADDRVRHARQLPGAASGTGSTAGVDATAGRGSGEGATESHSSTARVTCARLAVGSTTQRPNPARTNASSAASAASRVGYLRGLARWSCRAVICPPFLRMSAIRARWSSGSSWPGDGVPSLREAPAGEPLTVGSAGDSR